MMMGYGVGGLGLLVMVLIWFVIIALAIWLLSSLFPRINGSSTARGMGQAGTALELLQMRYARGEISRAEFEEMRTVLRAE